MNIKKILYVDDYTDKGELSRKDFITELVKKNNLEDYIDILDTTMNIDDFNLENYASLIVHENNKDFEYDQLFSTWEELKKPIPLVRFSGGYSGSVINQDNYGACHFEVIKRNLIPFISKYIETDKVNIEILVGFSAVLEAKIELIHTCFTPEGAKNIINSGFPQNLEKEKLWDKRLVELNPSFFNERNNETKNYAVYKEWTVEEIVKALSGDNTTNKKIEFNDFSDQNYLFALSTLIDCLLASEEQKFF